MQYTRFLAINADMNTVAIRRCTVHSSLSTGSKLRKERTKISAFRCKLLKFRLDCHLSANSLDDVIGQNVQLIYPTRTNLPTLMRPPSVASAYYYYRPCFNGNTPRTTNCVYITHHHVVKPKHTFAPVYCIPLLTVCGDGQPSQSRAERRGCLCVRFATVFPIPERTTIIRFS